MNNPIEKLLEQVKVNERIEKLAVQAGCTIDRLGYGEGNLEQFAKLIVRECARIQHKRFCEHGDVSWDILMEHFGVE